MFRFYFRFSEYAIAITIAILYYRNFVNLFFRVIWHVSAVLSAVCAKKKREREPMEEAIYGRVSVSFELSFWFNSYTNL